MKAPSIAVRSGAAAVLALALTACGSGGSTTGSPGADAVNTGAPLYSELPQAVKDAGVIVFVGDSHPPYRTIGEDGKTVTGLDPEVQTALSKQLGVPIRMEISEGLPQMLAGMQSGRYSAFNGPVKATKERLAEFDGISWLTSRTSYLIPADKASSLKSTAELCGTTASGVKGSITEEQTAKLSTWCKEQGKGGVEFLGLADTNATLLAVKSGRAASAATTQTGAIDIMLQQKQDWAYVSQTDEQGAGVDQLVLLTPKSTHLGPVFEKAFKNLFADGEYKALVEKWGLQDVKVDAPVLNPGM